MYIYLGVHRKLVRDVGSGRYLRYVCDRGDAVGEGAVSELAGGEVTMGKTIRST